MVVQLNVANVAVASRLADPITTAAPLSNSGNRSFNDALRTAQVETAPQSGPAPPPAKPATPPAKSTTANAPPAAKKPGDSAEQATAADAPNSDAAPTDAAPVVKSESDSANTDASATPQDDGDQPSGEVKDEAVVDEESGATASDAVSLAAVAIVAAAETAIAVPAVAEVAATKAEVVAAAPAVDAKAKTGKPTIGKEKPAPAGARASRAQTEKTTAVEKPTVEAATNAQAKKDVVEVAAASGEAAEAPVVAEALTEEVVVAPEGKKDALKAVVTEPKATTPKPAAETPQSPGAASQQAVALEATQGPAAETELKTETEPAAKRDVADVRTSEKTSAPLGATLATDANRPASATSAEAADATAAAIDNTTLDAAVETASLDGSSPRGNDTSAPNSQIAPAVAAPAAEAPRSVAHQVRHADVTQQVQNLNESERLRLIQRVSKALQSAGDAGGVLRLRLTPPELGAVRMEIKVRDGVMQAHLTAETETARAVLLENVPALRDRLAEQSIRLERFEVDLSDAPAGGLTQQPGDQRQPYEAQERGSSRGGAQRRGTAAAAVAAPAPAASRIFDDRGGLNVVI